MNSRRLLTGRRSERPQPLSRKDFDELISVAQKYPAGRDLIDISTVVFFTGLRARELARLRWRDVDFKKRSMFIASSKSGHERKVPFASKVLRILKARKEHQLKTDLVLGQHAQRTLTRVSQQLSALSLGVRLCSVSLHVLRDSFMVRWVKTGGSLVQLAYITRGAAIMRNFSTEMSFDHLYAEAARCQALLEESKTESLTPHGEPAAAKATAFGVKAERGLSK